MAKLLLPRDDTPRSQAIAAKWELAWDAAIEALENGDSKWIAECLRRWAEIPPLVGDRLAAFLERAAPPSRRRKLNVVQRREILAALRTAQRVHKEQQKTVKEQADALRMEPIELRRSFDDQLQRTKRDLANRYGVQFDTVDKIAKTPRSKSSPVRSRKNRT